MTRTNEPADGSAGAAQGFAPTVVEITIDAPAAETTSATAIGDGLADATADQTSEDVDASGARSSGYVAADPAAAASTTTQSASPHGASSKGASPQGASSQGEDGLTELSARICGVSATLACAPGEEPRLAKLAEIVDARASALAEAGFSGQHPLEDARLMLMTALCVADEYDDAKTALETATAAAEARLEEADAARRAAEDAAATAIARSEAAEAERARLEARVRAAETRAEAAETAAAEARAAAEAARDGDAAGDARRALETSFSEIVTRAAKRLEAAAGRLEGR